ncbi:hypothetical protein Zmor_005913 [Zophobas morio]|uniref:Uncharacterized protein n=1 Tax=Zophobas morio TaxID=2755281 RepID=A0AA38IVC6_9CUCU|nr:hypothetical protein Zmor_005913 [Zophobas morio]
MVIGASVVQHLRDHGTFNLKLTIVAVIRQKEEVGFSKLVVHPTLKEYGHIHIMLTKYRVWSPLIVHVVQLTFCPMELHILVNKYDFKRRFSINVYQLDETVRLWKSTVSRNYRRTSTSESGSRYSGVFLPINKPLATP